jgi:hypothetical protein
MNDKDSHRSKFDVCLSERKESHMYPGIPPIISLQIAADRHPSPCENMEEITMKHGKVIQAVTWTGRITLIIGNMLIRLGQKMTRSYAQQYKLSGKTL